MNTISLSSPSDECKMRVVISQPMYFPWVGLLEQIKTADIFVFYNDVQFARGFYNRVQLKTPNGQQWVTVPLVGHHRGDNINEIKIDESSDWRKKHRDLLVQNYKATPFISEMLDLVDRVFDCRFNVLSDLSKKSIVELINYFNLTNSVEIFDSEDLNINGKGSKRLLDIVKYFNGDVYVTGQGAANYLQHDLFEKSNVRVEYMDYACLPYHQAHGNYIPYVSSLDLVANCGLSGDQYISPKSVYWETFLEKNNE